MKDLYSRFLSARPGRLHFAAHSHHPWPDVTREAQIAAWDDAARLADLKWERVFSEVMPEAQAHIARVLDLSAPEQIAFAPNTHEFVSRILSCLPPGRPWNIVTTDSEFMSLSRQLARLEEDGHARVVRVATEPFDTFEARFAEAASAPHNDLVFFSQVFFNSGVMVRDLAAIVHAAPAEAMVVIDGYHSFFAVPTRLKSVADRAFFLAGGYKYAQSGEGVCFLAVPPGFDRRPLNTGWFADFGHLADARSDRVGFSNDGFRFMGATFDPVGLYRWNAVARVLDARGISVESIHAHVRALQGFFLDKLTRTPRAPFSATDLIQPASGLDGLGHFLTFRRTDAGALAGALAARNVIVDHRADRLRFGFGAYQDTADIEALIPLL